MDQRLEKLLKQIDLSLESLKYFDGGKIEKIVVYDDTKLWEFVIVVKNNLPVLVYDELYNKLLSTFNKVKIDLFIKVEVIMYDNIQEYFNKIIDDISIDTSRFSMFHDRKITYNERVITIDTYNKGEYIDLKKYKTVIMSKLFHYGLVIDDFVINIDNSDNEIKEKIEKEKMVDISLIPNVSKSINKENNDNGDNRVKYRAKKDTSITPIKDILYEIDNVRIEGKIFDIDYFEAKSGYKIITLKVTDEIDSILVKLFTKDDKEYELIQGLLKKNNWYQFYGKVSDDKFAHELVLVTRSRDIEKIEHEDNIRIDDAPRKRVELHVHTMMSGMDGICGVDIDKHSVDIVDYAIKFGHRAIAITDHNGCQAFPTMFGAINKFNKGKEEQDKLKGIYGTELVMVDDDIKLVVRPNDSVLLDNTYVVFDFETTGLNAYGEDSIIEIGAVKILNGEILDRFDYLIDPHHKLNPKITELTNITDEMLIGKEDEEVVVRRFIKWFGDLPMVAHNAKFDVSFLERAYQKYNLGTFNNTVLDTLEIDRAIDSSGRHGLSQLVKKYNVEWDEDAHHRADYDAEGTAFVLHKMLKKLSNMNINKMDELDKMVSSEDIHKVGRTFHINLIALDKTGLKNMFKIISLANTKYLYKTPRILKSELVKYREGLLVGSGCYLGEVFVEAGSKSEEELSNIIKFYDYVEVQPLDCYTHLIDSSEFRNKEELISHIKKIIENTISTGKLMVATGDVHFINPEDSIYREIIINQKVPGGGRHPLARESIKNYPNCYFRTTKEMLEAFDFLDPDTRDLIVIENTNKIADMVQEIEVIIDTGGIPFSPKIENSVETVKELVYGRARSLYGEVLPSNIEERIEQELSGIIKGGFDVIYLIAQKLVKKSNDDGYIVGSRGSVGSSFVATMMGITEVNPLPAHYRCSNCKHSIFDDEEGNPLGKKYSSGFDLPDMICPKCGSKLGKDGQDMPFATFLGFDADKVPDIDLNFSGDYQAKAHDYTKVLFGVDNVYRAGTIGTVAEKTAYGFVLGYYEDKKYLELKKKADAGGYEIPSKDTMKKEKQLTVEKRSVEIERLALGCTGVKRTTGQHPGGIVVIPGYMDVFDFTPFQFPADDVNAEWRTTHFDYHAIDQDVLKLDILGHDDPTMLRYLQDLSGLNIADIPLDDKDTMSIFASPAVLGVTSEQILCPTGTLGVPEMGTKFVVGMLVDTKPKTFSELIKISGLSHGTDVWLGNAQDLIKNNVVPFTEVIGCRDDIMVYLMYHGVKAKSAFKIMEFVRKGKASKEKDQWAIYKQEMTDAGIASWFIDSCQKIKYMFPKAHAAAYIISAFRIAWFKVHQPIRYYSAFFSIRCGDFDIVSMIKGYDCVRAKINEIDAKGFDASNKESAIYDVLCVALEMLARGFKFGNIDLYKSDSKYFVIDEDQKTLIPPFRSIDGLGEAAALSIKEEALKRPFISIEDFSARCKVSSTIIEKMRGMNVFDGMPETSQLTLF